MTLIIMRSDSSNRQFLAVSDFSEPGLVALSQIAIASLPAFHELIVISSGPKANHKLSPTGIGTPKTLQPIDEADLLRQLQTSVRPTQLAQRTVWPTLGAIAGNWIAIVCCVAALAFSPWYLHPVWLLLIAARQHALLILMHDASHFLICRSKACNDLISDLLCGFPFGVATRSYRANHISHHEHLNTGDDPDLVRTVGPGSRPEEWLFPMPHRRLFRFFAQDLFGRGFLYVIEALGDIAKKGRASKQSRCEYRWPGLVLGAHLVAVAALLYLSHKPWLILYAWTVPRGYKLNCVNGHRKDHSKETRWQSTSNSSISCWQITRSRKTLLAKMVC